jgi:broad specificity phosphatase PhoE
MTTRLVLIRHGESQSAVDEIMACHEHCTGLSELGVQQAHALRDRWTKTPEFIADVVYTSVLPRAIQTAEIVVPALGPFPVTQRCDLCEIHLGDADGMTTAEYQPLAFAWRIDTNRPVAPNGESLAGFRKRVALAIDRLIDEHEGQTMVLFCHGGVIRGATNALMNQRDYAESNSWFMLFENTSITEWQRDEPGSRWELVRLNDSAHLAVLA